MQVFGTGLENIVGRGRAMRLFEWSEFARLTKDSAHWPLVERAAEMVGRAGDALDLGCGAGRDTRYLLGQGWNVTAVDREPTGLAMLAALRDEKLRTVQSSIEDFEFEPDSYDLVSAQFSLPFIPRARFDETFGRIKGAIRPGGIFTGQFFGIHDDWNKPENDFTFLTREEVDALLADLTVIEFEEVDRMGTIVSGESKHWHGYHIIAHKPTAIP
jgi:tellurite methyltransferase